MDIFGITARFTSMFRRYGEDMRATGRTTLLAKTVKKGDGIVFITQDNIKAFQFTMKSLGLPFDGIEMFTMSTTAPLRAHGDRRTLQGQLYYDHSWLEQFHLDGIRHAAKFLDDLSDEMTGYNWRHRKTAEQARRGNPPNTRVREHSVRGWQPK